MVFSGERPNVNSWFQVIFSTEEAENQKSHVRVHELGELEGGDYDC